jgi:Ca-activated chloride channel homolog
VGVKRAILLAVVALVSAPAFATGWRDLWVTREQRAQHLLDTGNPAAAAALFCDPRRRAYAKMKAGQYAAAARELAPYRDADSQYNRGNALARMGNLSAALTAYDAAIKEAPKDADVIHNRALVADALRQQQRTQTQQGHDSKPSSDKSAGTSSANRSTGAGFPGTSAGRSRSSSDAGGSSMPKTSNSPEAGQVAAAHESPPQQGREDRNQLGGHPNVASGSISSAASNSSPPAMQGRNAFDGTPRPSEAADSRRAPAQGKPSTGKQSDSVAGKPVSERNSHSAGQADTSAVRTAAASKSPPESEQSIAMDQWLRQIPDDSAELLRRKFLIEHMMKQQERR